MGRVDRMATRKFVGREITSLWLTSDKKLSRTFFKWKPFNIALKQIMPNSELDERSLCRNEGISGSLKCGKLDDVLIGAGFEMKTYLDAEQGMNNRYFVGKGLILPRDDFTSGHGS